MVINGVNNAGVKNLPILSSGNFNPPPKLDHHEIINKSSITIGTLVKKSERRL